MIWKRAVAGAVGSIAAVALAAGVALAADPKPPSGSPHDADPETKAMMEAMAKLAAPGPEHEALEPLVGKWNTKTTAWVGPGDPIVSDGSAEYSWLFGGRFLEYRAKGLMWGQPFEGYELMGYDRLAKTYTAIWVDNTSTILYTIKSGSYDAATQTFTYDAEWPNPMGQGKTPYKLTTKVLGPDSHVFTMSDMTGGKETKMMETTYTRIK